MEIQFICLRANAEVETEGLSSRDVFVILCLAERLGDFTSAIPEITQQLQQDGGLSNEQCGGILRQTVQSVNGGSAGSDLQSFLKAISQLVSFETFVVALRSAGLIRLADVLILERFGEPGSYLASAEIPNARIMSRFYNSVKNLLNSGKIPNKGLALANFTGFLQEIACRNSLTGTVDQIVIDKLAILACLRVNVEQDNDKKLAILKELRKHIPSGVDKSSTEMVCCIATCMMTKVRGDFEASKHHLDEAKMLNDLHTNSFFKLLICHTQHLLFRSLYTRQPSSENLQEALTACHVGITRAIPETEAICRPWTNTFTVFSALLHLRIGQLFEILPGTEPDEKNRKLAEEIIMSVKRGQEGKKWDSRREMMYQLIMARLHETTERNQAIEECRRARAEAKSGAYTPAERRNLRAYYNQLTCVA